MRETLNIQKVLALNPDFMGFIFYANSPRNAEGQLDENLLHQFPKSTQKVGVFVNADLDFIISIMTQYRLDIIQLHGNESPTRCAELKAKGYTLIKAFGINQHFEWEKLNAYQSVVDFFLFDTKGNQPGGNGVSFDWDSLSNYKLNTPYFLSGGLSPENIKQLKTKNLPQLFAVDLNSKFEIEPGLKDIDKLKSIC